MGLRLQLHDILKEVMTDLGYEPNVYFQPPTNTVMQYPCIVYQRDYAQSTFADNQAYRYLTRYQTTVIDANPDSPITSSIAALPSSSYQRFFAADSLNHDIFNLYF